MKNDYTWKTKVTGPDLIEALKSINIMVDSEEIRYRGAVDVLGNTIIILIERIKQLEEKVNGSDE